MQTASLELALRASLRLYCQDFYSFSYVCHELVEDEKAGLWGALFIAFICKNASYVLQRSYENYRLSALSGGKIRCNYKLGPLRYLRH